LEEEPVKFGLTTPLPPTNNPFKLIFHEWMSIKKDVSKKIPLATKIKYLFKDVPETIDLFKNLFEGKLKIIDFSNKNSFEKNTSTKQVNRSIQT
jgi:hypothetical protein